MPLPPCAYDPDLREFNLAVELKTHGYGLPTWVRMWNSQEQNNEPWYGPLDNICVAIGSNDLHATRHKVVLPDHDHSLPRFLADLAADFHGWSGVRTMATWDRDLTLDATFTTGGHVNLTGTLRPWHYTTDWQASVTTTVEAGEQLTNFATTIHDFLTP